MFFSHPSALYTFRMGTKVYSRSTITTSYSQSHEIMVCRANHRRQHSSSGMESHPISWLGIRVRLRHAFQAVYCIIWIWEARTSSSHLNPGFFERKPSTLITARCLLLNLGYAFPAIMSPFPVISILSCLWVTGACKYSGTGPQSGVMTDHGIWSKVYILRHT
jgi:hypothetical protein